MANLKEIDAIFDEMIIQLEYDMEDSLSECWEKEQTERIKKFYMDKINGWKSRMRTATGRGRMDG